MHGGMLTFSCSYDRDAQANSQTNACTQIGVIGVKNNRLPDRSRARTAKWRQPVLLALNLNHSIVKLGFHCELTTKLTRHSEKQGFSVD